MINLKLKTGAMFGLDARIALAIFGALSVISGAALYSAIQSAKAERYRQHFENLIKASEQYYLDIGTPLPQFTDNNTVYISDLVNNRQSLSNWKGPYVDGYAAGSFYIIDPTVLSASADTAHIINHLQTMSNWTDTNTNNFCAVNNTDCAEYIGYYANHADGKVELENTFRILDELVDGSDGCGAGKVRCQTRSTATMYYLLYQGMIRQRKS